MVTIPFLPNQRIKNDILINFKKLIRIFFWMRGNNKRFFLPYYPGGSGKPVIRGEFIQVEFKEKK